MPIDNMLVSTLISNDKVKLSKVSSIGLLLFVLSVALFLSGVFIDKAEAHKLLEIPYDNNMEFESSLTIPNHTVSWAIYQGLGGQDNVTARFYKFDNKEINSRFYSQISIPKVEKYINFTPSLYLIGPLSKDGGNDTLAMLDNAADANQAKNGRSINNNLPFGMPQGYHTLIQSDYNGAIPSQVFYEPFTQTSYWERQEIRTLLPGLGVYYVVVFDRDGSVKIDKNSSSGSKSSINEGKFSLAVGETEDFSIQDYLVLLPYSWIKVKLFFNDYLSIFVAFIVIVFLVIVLPSLILIMGKKRKKAAN